MLKSALGQIEPSAPGAVVVCGGGAAGIAAALAAARKGSEVLLLEQGPSIGGTVANAQIHTLGGLYDSAGDVINSGLPAELIERLQRADPRTRRRKLGRAWVLNVCPRVYQAEVCRWLAEHPQISVLDGVRVTAAQRAEDQIVDLTAVAGRRSISLRPRAIIDATGTAEITRLLDPSLVQDDGPRAAGGWIFRLSNVAPGALAFPKGVGLVRDLRAAAATGALPPLASHAWLDEGIADDEVFVKLIVPLGTSLLACTPAQDAIVEYLRRLPAFAYAAVMQTGSLGVRDGGRIRGRYTLTADDVRQGRCFKDAVCRCAWPIEYWDAERGVSVEYLQPGVHYEIPLRALQVEGIDNFWVAGKCLSADRWAHASARVAGTCWAMGQAVGRAAAEQSRVGCAHQTNGNEWWAQPTLQTVTNNLYQQFLATAERQPRHSAVVGPRSQTALLYGELNAAIVSASEWLRELGVRPGDCVGLHCPSTPQYIIYTYAIWRSGGCVVPIPPELTAPEKREICHCLALDCVITPPAKSEFLDEFRSGNGAANAGDALVRIESPRQHPAGFRDVNAAFIRFTSGTTGSSKGVVLSHETIGERIAAANITLGLSPTDRVLWVLSMSYHFTVSIVAYLTYGATIVLPPNHFAAAIVNAIREQQATLLYASPMHYSLLADYPLGAPLPSLRLAISTTSSLDERVAAGFHDRYGRPISQALGIIEAGLPCIHVDATPDRWGSVGRVLPPYQLRLEDAGLGADLKEVLLSGPGFLDAYYDPWQTRTEIMPGGWFRTGDVGHLDAQGYLHLAGRTKDVINVMGMKFFPHEVERVLAAHPHVRAASVFSGRDPRWGERVHARIVASDSATASGGPAADLERQLRRYCQQRLASYKVPERIEFVAALPQTASGKVLHRAI